MVTVPAFRINEVAHFKNLNLILHGTCSIQSHIGLKKSEKVWLYLVKSQKSQHFWFFFNGAAWKVGRSCTIFSQSLFPFWLKTSVKLLHSLVNYVFFSLNDKNISKPDCSRSVHTGNLNTTYTKNSYVTITKWYTDMLVTSIYIKVPYCLGGSNNIKKIIIMTKMLLSINGE